MRRVALPAHHHADDRGTILDLLVEPVDSITLIHTEQGGVRGNHYHRETTQWTYVVKGMLFMTDGDHEAFVFEGDMVIDEPGSPHAWKACVDTQCLVFTKGPRSGENFESDTIRLSTPLIETAWDWDAAEGISRTG